MNRKKPVSAAGIRVWCDHHELVNPGELVDYPGNPNHHSEEQLRRIIGIIRSNGWRDAIVVSRLTDRMTKGHGRKQAAILAGWASVPVEYQDYETEADEKRDVIADNRAREGSELNEQEMAAVLASLSVEELEGAGFTPEEMEVLSETTEEKEKPQVPFATWLDETNNYVVLKFSNDINWIAAMTHFELRSEAAKRTTGKPWSIGIGRVIDGAKYLARITT